jgi:hypothetical protein
MRGPSPSKTNYSPPPVEVRSYVLLRCGGSHRSRPDLELRKRAGTGAKDGYGQAVGHLSVIAQTASFRPPNVITTLCATNARESRGTALG